MPQDEFDTIISNVTADYPTPATGPPQDHPVLWFAVGTILWLAAGVLAYVLAWLVLHG